jgi:hypothetical protein
VADVPSKIASTAQPRRATDDPLNGPGQRSSAPDPEIEETIKRTVQPYFVLEGNVCALLAAKDHVNLFLYDGAIVPDPEGIITAGHGNQTARTISFRTAEDIRARPLATMLREIIANNRAGGWRRRKAQGRA